MKTARQRLAWKIAEAIESEITVYGNLDIDDFYEVIERLLPSTYEEIEAELEKMRDDLLDGNAISKPEGPTLMQRLREAVHATPEMSLKTTLEAAIKIINEAKDETSTP